MHVHTGVMTGGKLHVQVHTVGVNKTFPYRIRTTHDRHVAVYARSVMIAYIPRTFHSVPAYYACTTTTVRERFIDTYCTCS